MLYGTDTVQAGILSVNEDDDPNNDLSKNEFDEMFCRVGRYAE